jgi:transposase
MNSISKAYIGVDISKDSLDICIYPLNKFFKIANTKDNITRFIKQITQYEVAAIACEATGSYEKLLARICNKHGYNLWVIDPRRIKGFIIASGCKSKTDKIDAQKIAQFAAQNIGDHKIVIKTETQEKLQSFVNRKADLTAILGMEKTRLKQPAHMLSLSSIKKMIKVLETEIKNIDYKIKTLMDQDSELSLKTTLLESIPGIGKHSAAVLLAHVNELGLVNKRQISALVGVCPYDRSSGKYKGKKFIRGGRRVPRNALYMCALTTIKYNLIFKKFYDRLIEKGKPFKVAIIAVMHKLIILANALLKKGELCKV